MANQECNQIADQLRRAFEGKAWHGDSLRELLTDVKAAQANAHPFPKAHSIWELVLHITVWTRAADGTTHGQTLAKIVGTPEDWPAVSDASPEAWEGAVNRLFKAETEFASSIERFADARLTEIVPGRTYDFYHLFHGIVQHSLYHAGQIALLKKS